MSTLTPLRAFHGKQEIKDDLIAQLEAHRAADEIIQGIFWKNGRGCAVGCCTHSEYNAHVEMGIQFGIDESVAYLIDRIFESLTLAKAKKFPLQVIRAIPVGADLSKIGRQMKVYALNQARAYAFDDGKAIIDTVLALLARSLSGDEPEKDEWEAARSTAWSAADAADAEDAEYAADAARCAAWSAADAEYAADSAANAAWYAVRSAAYAARSAAYCAAWSAQRDEFLRLLTVAN